MCDYPGVVSVAVLPKCGVKAVYHFKFPTTFFSHYISLLHSAAAKVASLISCGPGRIFIWPNLGT